MNTAIHTLYQELDQNEQHLKDQAAEPIDEFERTLFSPTIKCVHNILSNKILLGGQKIINFQLEEQGSEVVIMKKLHKTRSNRDDSFKKLWHQL